MTIQDEKILQRWKAKNQLTTRTFKMYKSVMQHYIRCTQMSITELYNEAITEEENNTPRYRKKINNHIIDYYNYLEQTNLSENTKNNHIYIITSFYKFIDVEIPNIKNRFDATPNAANVEKMITKELIQLMIQNARTRDKAILSFAALTGQSPDEIRHITIQQLIDCYNTELKNKILTVTEILQQKKQILELPAPMLKLKRQKTKTHYWIYIPSETNKYIIDYLHERMHGNNSKIQIKDNDDYLFVTKTGTQMGVSAVGKVFTETGRRCGFEHPENLSVDYQILLKRRPHEHRVWKAYNYRKYFINTCRRYAGTRLDSKTEFVFSGRELADFWVGHVPSGSIKHYIQYNHEDVDEMQMQYLQVLPYLSVETEVQTVTTADKEEFLEMKQSYQEVLEEMEQLKNYIRSKEELARWKDEQGI